MAMPKGANLPPARAAQGGRCAADICANMKAA
jgi:hypothetical protein